ncbi:MAG: SUMF1/EgtB/PvdO family nonheme iron enzyme [Desulfobacteraceae bacterium]
MKNIILCILEVAMILFSLNACGGDTEKPGMKSDTGKSLSESVSPMDKGANISKIMVPEGFVLIKGGTFNMGSPGSEAWRGDDETLHPVTVNDFFMNTREVTQKEYLEIMGNNPSAFSGANLPDRISVWLRETGVID